MLTFIQGDITAIPTDAIVNGAIHRAAGPGLPAACRAVAPCPTGEARITPGFDLPARHIIHTVGPVWSGGDRNEAGLLASAYRNSIRLADEYGLRTVAFPAISCGIFGYPIGQAAQIAVNTVREAMSGTSVQEVTFVLFTHDLLATFEAAAAT